MSRETAYKTRTIQQPYTVQQLVCDVCGQVEDIEPLSRPEGWISVQRTIDGRPIAKDFHDWGCFHGWVIAEGEQDGTVLQEWTAAVEEISGRG